MSRGLVGWRRVFEAHRNPVAQVVGLADSAHPTRCDLSLIEQTRRVDAYGGLLKRMLDE